MAEPASTNTEQRTLHFSGRVQGVGFRQTTRMIAEGLAVNGYVMNLPDGRVKLVAEGTKKEIDALEQQLAERMGQYIRDTQRDVRPATGQFDSFDIRY